jgi:hypothetical protein
MVINNAKKIAERVHAWERYIDGNTEVMPPRLSYTLQTMINASKTIEKYNEFLYAENLKNVNNAKSLIPVLRHISIASVYLLMNSYLGVGKVNDEQIEKTVKLAVSDVVKNQKIKK